MNSVTRNCFNYWVASSVVSVLHCLISVEESGFHVMLLEGWPKYGRARQSVKQPKTKCMKRCCWAYCVTTRKHGHLLQKQTDSSEFLKWDAWGGSWMSREETISKTWTSEPTLALQRGYSRKNPGKKTTIFRSCGQNGSTPSAKHCAKW